MGIGIPEEERKECDSEEVSCDGEEGSLENGGTDNESVSGTKGLENTDLTALVKDVDIHDHRNDDEYRNE